MYGDLGKLVDVKEMDEMKSVVGGSVMPTEVSTVVACRSTSRSLLPGRVAQPGTKISLTFR